MNQILTEQLTTEEFYSEASRSGTVLGLKCDKGHVTVPPRHSCRLCNSTVLKLEQLSGYGTIISFTEVYVKSKDFPLETPYTLALVRLEEGGNLLGVADKKVKSSGEKVKVNFRSIRGVNDKPTIFFETI
jgi:uncharacterized OB-fold protein